MTNCITVELVPSAKIVLGVNVSAALSVAALTVKFAVALAIMVVAPLGPVALKFAGVIVLVFVPEVLAVTVTVTVQVVGVVGVTVAAAILAPLKDTVPELATADTVPPVQVVEAFGVAATTNPVGKVSVKPILE
jgi:hypothetical protein